MGTERQGRGTGRWAQGGREDWEGRHGQGRVSVLARSLALRLLYVFASGSGMSREEGRK